MCHQFGYRGNLITKTVEVKYGHQQHAIYFGQSDSDTAMNCHNCDVVASNRSQGTSLLKTYIRT